MLHHRRYRNHLLKHSQWAQKLSSVKTNSTSSHRQPRIRISRLFSKLRNWVRRVVSIQVASHDWLIWTSLSRWRRISTFLSSLASKMEVLRVTPFFHVTLSMHLTSARERRKWNHHHLATLTWTRCTLPPIVTCSGIQSLQVQMLQLQMLSTHNRPRTSQDLATRNPRQPLIISST